MSRTPPMRFHEAAGSILEKIVQTPMMGKNYLVKSGPQI